MSSITVRVAALLLLCAGLSAQPRVGIRRTEWGTTATGEKVELFTLTGAGGLQARISNFGGVIVSLDVPNRSGGKTDVVLGYDDLAAYEKGGVYGAVIGRFANRIGSNGTFPLNGRTVQLERASADQKVVLHSGASGFQKKVWRAEMHDGAEPRLALTLVSPDGEGGFPGRLTTTVTYTVTRDNALRIEYRAATDAPTVVNLTNHAYFALQGEGVGDISNQQLQVFADRFTPTARDSVPTGEIATVTGTPLDFRRPVRLGDVLDSSFEQISLRRGLDLNMVVNGAAGTLRPAARISDPDTGIVMDVSTTQPGVQLYTTNVTRSTAGKGGKAYGNHAAICFETQHYPDSPNRPEFPSTVVTPSAPLHEETVYRFSLQANAQTAAVPQRNPRVVTSEGPEQFTTRVVARDLAGPWDVAWGPDGFLWITERTGKRIVRVNPEDGSRSVAVTIDDVHQELSQDGLLGLALHPDLLKGKGADYVYVAYTYDADPGSALDRRMKVRRYAYDRQSQRLQNPVDVITRLPHGTDHGGGRLVFGPDGKLYLGRGDHGNNFLANYCQPILAQDLPSSAAVQASDWTLYQGKILRINLDGSIPRDNPIIGGVRSHIYSYGHRNPQGLAFAGDRLFESEHGESVDDEVNLLSAGGNYGWPLIAGYRDDQSYTYANWSKSSPQPCTSLTFNGLNPPPSVPRVRESEAQVPNFVPAAQTFFTVPAGYDLRGLGNATAAPTGLEVYTSRAIPGWRNSLLLATMISGVVFRMPISADRTHPLGAPIAYFKTGNRYRDVVVAPDGLRFYVLTDVGGRTINRAGAVTQELANPGSVLEFKYANNSAAGQTK